VFKKLAVGDVFAPRVAEDALELHRSDGAVQQTAVGDTYLFVSAGAGTTIDVAASARVRLAPDLVRPEGLLAINPVLDG